MFDRCKGTANPPNRQILIEFFMQKNLESARGQVPGSNWRSVVAARYLSPWQDAVASPNSAYHAPQADALTDCDDSFQ